MGQFRIPLPNNQFGDVRFGTVTRKQFNILELLRLKRDKLRKNVGYIVKVRPVLGDIPEYHFMKSGDGKWLAKADCDWVREGDGSMSEIIKSAIEAFEDRNS